MEMNTSITDDAPGLSLRDMYHTVFRHQRIFALVAAGSAVAALCIALFFIGTAYESSASILLRTGRESMAVDPTAGAGDQVRMRSRDEEIRTEMEIIRSREVVEAVVASFGIDFFLKQQRESGGALNKFLRQGKAALLALGGEKASPQELELQKQRFHDALIDTLMNVIWVEPLKNSSLFSVSFQGPSPEFAQEFLRRLIAVYLDKHSGLYFTDTAYRFLNEKTEKFRTELEQVESTIKEFKNKESSALIQEQRFLDQFASLQQEVRNTESALASAQAKAKLLRERLSGQPRGSASAAGGDTSGVAADELYRRLSALQIQEQTLLSTYTEKSVPVQEVRRQIQQLRGMLPRMVRRSGAEPAAGISLQTWEGLQLELIAEEGTVSSLQAMLAVQKEKLASLEEQFRDVNENGLYLTQMERKRTALEESYKRFSDNLQQARIDQSLKLEKISNITIAQQPTYSLRPVKTKKLAVLLVGLLGGLVAAMALAFTLENMDHSLKTPEDVRRKLNLRFLASLPQFSDVQSLIPEMLQLPNLVMLPRPMQNTETRRPEPPSAGVIKYFDALMHLLVFSDREQRRTPCVIAVTSARSGEGVSTVAANLAVRLARLGQGHVLLVDMNLLNLDAHESAPGPYPQLGNMLALQAKKDAGQLPSALIDKLYLIQYSGQKHTPTEVRELQGLWQKDYEFVVIDVPPVLNNGGASFLARLADKVILVIQAERERWQVVRRALDLLEEASANVVGAILNRRVMYIPEWLYRHL